MKLQEKATLEFHTCDAPLLCWKLWGNSDSLKHIVAQHAQMCTNERSEECDVCDSCVWAMRRRRPSRQAACSLCRGGLMLTASNAQKCKNPSCDVICNSCLLEAVLSVDSAEGEA